MHHAPDLAVILALLAVAGAGLAGCAGPDPATPAPSASEAATAGPEPPPATRAWMDRLTVAHAWDPETGFIVAKETVELPPILADGPRLDVAVERARDEGSLVIVFATADRCAPCQQYKHDALSDPRVVARLAEETWIATHVEVDRDGALADAYLGGRGIPMTYALRDGRPVGELRGQRTADELLAWLDALPAG